MQHMSDNSTDMILLWLCQELEQLAEKAKILDLTDVWDRYCTIAKESCIDIPSSFLSRQSTFKEKLAGHLENIYEFIVLHDQPQTEPRTVMVPCKFKHIPVSALVKDEELIPSFKHVDNNSFLNMVHVAFQIRADMLSHPKPQGIDIGEASAIDSIPSSLYMFLNL